MPFFRDARVGRLYHIQENLNGKPSGLNSLWVIYISRKCKHSAKHIPRKGINDGHWFGNTLRTKGDVVRILPQRYFGAMDNLPGLHFQNSPPQKQGRALVWQIRVLRAWFRTSSSHGHSHRWWWFERRSLLLRGWLCRCRRAMLWAAGCQFWCW